MQFNTLVSALGKKCIVSRQLILKLISASISEAQIKDINKNCLGLFLIRKVAKQDRQPDCEGFKIPFYFRSNFEIVIMVCYFIYNV